jgi:hypothetical protein
MLFSVFPGNRIQNQSVPHHANSSNTRIIPVRKPVVKQRCDEILAFF